MELNENKPLRKNPIKRNNKFFGKEDGELQINFMKEYMEENANQTIILYQVDYHITQVDDLYMETKKDAIRFKTPIELPVIYEVTNSEMRTYNSQGNKGLYSKIGKLTFSVLLSTLEEYHCDINRGDYIGIQIDPTHREYWVVTDDGRVNSIANKFTLYGTMPYARTITAAAVDANEFKG